MPVAEEAKAIVEGADTVKAEAPVDVKDADEQAEDKDATAPIEEEVKTPFKVPTLYVRNLNDKTKVEGKYSIHPYSETYLQIVHLQ